MSIEDLAVLELHEHGVALRRVQEAEGQLRASSVSFGASWFPGICTLTIVRLRTAGFIEIAVLCRLMRLGACVWRFAA